MRKFDYSFLNNGQRQQCAPGYLDALNAVHTGYEYIDFRESNILRPHATTTSIAGYEFGGKYKTDDNVILEVESLGPEKTSKNDK